MVNNIRQIDPLPTILSPFEEMIKDHFDWVKEKYERKKDELKLLKKHLVEIKYLEKFEWLQKYLDFLEVFHINELHRHIELMKEDLGDRSKKTPHKTTLGDYLHRMFLQRNQFGENLLGFKALPSNLPNMYKIYWVPGTHKDKIKDKIQSIVDSYKEPKTKKDKRQQQLDNTVQARITNFKANIIADKLIVEEKKQLSEKQELERQKQMELEKQQREIENKEKNERKKAALIKRVDKETVKKSKKTKNGSRILTEEELKANFKKNQKEIEIAREEQEYQAIKAKRAREKTVSGGSGK